MKSLLQDAEGLHVGFNAESLLRAELRNLCAEKVMPSLFSLSQPSPPPPPPYRRSSRRHGGSLIIPSVVLARQ